jgi:hypothetical protein
MSEAVAAAHKNYEPGGSGSASVTVRQRAEQSWSHLELREEPGSCVGDDDSHLWETPEVAVCTDAIKALGSRQYLPITALWPKPLSAHSACIL